MIRLTDEQWERIRKHFPEAHIPDGRAEPASQIPELVMCWKRFCGFSTQVRNGTCCRKAIRTTKLCIDAWKAVLPRDFASGFDLDVANELS